MPVFFFLPGQSKCGHFFCFTFPLRTASHAQCHAKTKCGHFQRICGLSLAYVCQRMYALSTNVSPNFVLRIRILFPFHREQVGTFHKTVRLWHLAKSRMDVFQWWFEWHFVIMFWNQDHNGHFTTPDGVSAMYIWHELSHDDSGTLSSVAGLGSLNAPF